MKFNFSDKRIETIFGAANVEGTGSVPSKSSPARKQNVTLNDSPEWLRQLLR
jgi:hypothetical protein